MDYYSSGRPVITGISGTQRDIDEFRRDEQQRFRKLLNVYFRPRECERGEFYENVGIRSFKRGFLCIARGSLRMIFGESAVTGEEPMPYFTGRDRSLYQLITFETETRFYESFHVLLCLIAHGSVIFDGEMDITQKAMLVVLGTMINLPFVFLQRYNRARIYNTIDAIERSETSST